MTVTHEPAIAPPAAESIATIPIGIGRVEAIHLTAAAQRPMRFVERRPCHRRRRARGRPVCAAGPGTTPTDPKVDRQITLIAAEELDRLAAVESIELSPAETRRNVLTRGIDVNALVGRRFRLGGVECEGTRLCEPAST